MSFTVSWPTEQQDLQAAAGIINRYVELNEGNPLGLVEVAVRRDEKKNVEVRLSDWMRELITHFRRQYGKEQGRQVAAKVITRILLKDETIH
jgi:hypothetical protein